jgi:hypothetical protein
MLSIAALSDKFAAEIRIAEHQASVSRAKLIALSATGLINQTGLSPTAIAVLRRPPLAEQYSNHVRRFTP